MRLRSDRGADSQSTGPLELPARDAEPVCPKFLAVQRWATRRLGCVRHERQVAAIASSAFDLTRPLHKLSLADRRLLRLGALVHDVGRCVSKEDHPKEGAWMILADATMPLTPADRRAIAYLTLYHRDEVPELGRDAILHRNDDHERMRYVLAFLRTADTLDSRSLADSTRLVFALVAPTARNTPRELRATCYLTADSPKARKVYRRRKKFRLLEELLDIRIEVQIDQAEALRLVA